MAAGTWTPFSKAALNLTQGKMNLLSDTYVMVLLTSAWAPAVNTNETWADISASELSSGAGYTAGGKPLTTVTDALATATVAFDADDVSWTTFSATTAKYAVLVRRAGGALTGTDLLLAYLDLNTGGGAITGGGGTLTITTPAGGFLTMTHSP